jgi:hypothetical protein
LLPAYAGVVGMLALVWAYTAGASQLQLLWAELGQLPPRQGERQASPEWYGSALSDRAALGGVVLGGALAALAPLAGGAWGLLVLAAGLPMNDGGRLLHSFAGYIFSLLDVSRLPHFLLASGCLVLAFRRHWIRPLLPLLSGLVPAVHWLLGSVLYSYSGLQENALMVWRGFAAYLTPHSLLAPGAGRIMLIFAPVWLAPALLILLYFGLRDCALQRGPAPANYFLVGVMLGLPHLLAWIWGVEQWHAGWSNQQGTDFFHAAVGAGAWFNSTLFVLPGAWLYAPRGDILQAELLGSGVPAALALLVVWWAGTLLFWWKLGLVTLRAARSHA